MYPRGHCLINTPKRQYAVYLHESMKGFLLNSVSDQSLQYMRKVLNSRNPCHLKASEQGGLRKTEQ